MLRYREWGRSVGQFARHWRLKQGRWNGKSGLAGLTGLVGLVLVTVGPAAAAASWYGHSHRAEPERTAAHYLGLPVREGQLEFVVHEIRCGAHEQATQGRLCRVMIGARNQGEQAVTVPGTAQHLRSAEGARHQPMDQSTDSFGTLEPGEAAVAVLDFDLPLQTSITQVEVHSDVYSRGVPVDLDGPPLPLLE